MTSLLPSEVLSRAADLIEPEGAWARGWLFRDATGRDIALVGRAPPSAPCSCCLIGAMIIAAGNTDDPGHQEARRLIASTVGVNWRQELAAWNDAPERTQSEVVSALRAASELARREGK